MSTSGEQAGREPVVGAVRSAVPPSVDQAQVRDLAVQLSPGLAESRYLSVFANAGIERRALVQPLEWYAVGHPIEQRWSLAAHCATELGGRAGTDALEAAGVAPTEVDALVVASTTVLRAPALDATLVPVLGLRDDVRRVPLFGLASLGGAAGLAVAADLVRAGHRNVLLVAAEINSLMFVPGDDSPEALVTMALFSDGAAAAVVSSAGSPATNGTVCLVGSHATLLPGSLDVMGFEPAASGLRWRLASDVPQVARQHTAASVDAALAGVGWTRANFDHLLLHPGGVKVLSACAEALGLDEHRLERSFSILREHGNLSGATVLAVLERFLADGPPPGRGLLTAMGPGFGFEHVLFEA